MDNVISAVVTNFYSALHDPSNMLRVPSQCKKANLCDVPPPSRGCQWTMSCDHVTNEGTPAMASACQNSFLLTGRRKLGKIVLHTCCVYRCPQSTHLSCVL